jgi:type I restriction enzyme S subunit
MNNGYNLNKWTWKTLGDIASSEGYGLVDGPFGSDLPASCYTKSGIPVIRGSNLTLGIDRFVADEFVYISEETASRLKRSLARPNDIIFTKKGTIGQTGLIPNNLPYNVYLIS